MMKLTGQTTFAELVFARGRFGITRMSFDFDYNGDTVHRVRFTVFDRTGARVVGTGATEIEAMDDGIARLWHLEAQTVLVAEPRIPHEHMLLALRLLTDDQLQEVLRDPLVENVRKADVRGEIARRAAPRTK